MSEILKKINKGDIINQLSSHIVSVVNTTITYLNSREVKPSDIGYNLKEISYQEVSEAIINEVYNLHYNNTHLDSDENKNEEFNLNSDEIISKYIHKYLDKDYLKRLSELNKER